MNRLVKAAAIAVAALLVAVGPALADGGGHDHGGHDFEYKDADCTPVDDAGGDDSLQLVEEREHHGNGRTECVVADGAGTPVQDVACSSDTEGDDCYIAYDPYQEDTQEGNSPNDRGAALRYHNGDDDAAGGGHGHGEYGCWSLGGASARRGGEGADPVAMDPEDVAEAQAAEDELEARLNAAGARYTGPAGLANYAADFWYFYPVGAAKTFHFVRTQQPDLPHTVVVAEAVEVFTSGMTDGENEDDPADDGLQHFNAMFSLGNEGPVKNVYADAERTMLLPEYDVNGDGYLDNDVAGIDYKRVLEQHLPLWQSPDTQNVCDLPWHPHTGVEGVATSFDAENPDVSAWMAHIMLYKNGGDIWGTYGASDGAEAHAQWQPLNHVPALCNPTGPCL